MSSVSVPPLKLPEDKIFHYFGNILENKRFKTRKNFCARREKEKITWECNVGITYVRVSKARCTPTCTYNKNTVFRIKRYWNGRGEIGTRGKSTGRGIVKLNFS